MTLHQKESQVPNGVLHKDVKKVISKLAYLLTLK